MDSVPTLRNPNLPFSIDPSAGSSTGIDPHSFYYKQLQGSPLQPFSEWGDNENVPSKLPAHGSSKHSAVSSGAPKIPGGTLRTREGTTTPSKVPTKQGAAELSLLSPNNAAAMVTSAQPPSIVRPLPVQSFKTPAKANNVSQKDILTSDILWAMLNDLTGKDKMAKLAQYSLRLLLHHSKKTQAYLSDETVNIRLISETYASNKKVLDLVVGFIRDPQAFAKVLVILTCSVFTSRLAGFVPALGLYRQLLRFGKSPFRLNMIMNKVKQSMYKDTKSHTWRINEKFFSKSTLGDCIAFYYSINDDISLLHKVKLLKNKTLRAFASRHEAYAWYCDSWLALYNAYNNLQRYSQQELDMRISIQVKQRSRALSRQVLGATSLAANSSHVDDDIKDMRALQDIQFRITNARLDIYKTVSDIIFNSYTVFNAKLHFDTVQIWMGISASFLSAVKLYREKKKALASP